MTATDIYEAMNSKAESFFEWAQANPKYGLLFTAGLLAFWLTGLLLRWKWACHWQFNGKLWLFDGCKPETRRRIQYTSSCKLCTFNQKFIWRAVPYSYRE